MLKYYTESAEETAKVGERLGKLLSPEILCASGDLGAGRLLLQGIARGLEVRDYVTSPTYTIINEYEGRVPLYH